ncbi:MAG: glycosyltransferase family 2 protein [Chloroflexota bacterium]
MSITIVIPAYNEAPVIGNVLADVIPGMQDLVQQVIVVDDGSQDDTATIAESAGATVIRHRNNQGYGAALKTGIRAAETNHILIMDSDGQHRLDDARRLSQAITEEDMIIGARENASSSPLWRRPGKWVLGKLANYIVGMPIPDLNSGLRIFRRDVALRYLHICPSGFSMSSTMTIALHTRNYTVDYRPITVEKRVGSSTVSLKTGFQTLLLIVRLAALFDPLRVFLPLSLILGAIAVLWGLPYLLLGRGLSVTALLFFLSGVQMFGMGIICDQVSQLRLERYE